MRSPSSCPFIHSFTADERASLQKPPQSLATIASETAADLEFKLRLRNNFLLNLFCELLVDLAALVRVFLV